MNFEQIQRSTLHINLLHLLLTVNRYLSAGLRFFFVTEAATGGVLCLAPACNFTKKDTLAQVLSCEFFEIFNNISFTEHIRVTASVLQKTCALTWHQK